MVISEENRRCLQIIRLTTEVVEANEKMRLALIEVRQHITDSDMLAEIDAALKS